MARKAALQNQYRLVGTYERLRKSLLASSDHQKLQRALSYWVLPTDRRLPIAFLDTTLGELLSRSLEELMATPGVGQKKMLGFFDLLRRIAKSPPSDEPFGLSTAPGGQVAASLHLRGSDFDPSTVSEALWSTWCDTARRYGLCEVTLGRLAPSLRPLPTVIWHVPLRDYVGLPLAEVRRLRTHGEKRVQAILEVFCTVHEAFSTAALHENLDLQLTPRFVPPLNRWLTEAEWRESLPPADLIRRRVVAPMVAQIDIDLGPQVARLARERLLRGQEAAPVKQQAEALGVTRARVYQLLDDCAKVMDVRWPEGRCLLAPLLSTAAGPPAESGELLRGVRDLFFPAQRPGRPPKARRATP